MIVRIPKYAEGGSALPFVDYMPFEGVGAPAASLAGASTPVADVGATESSTSSSKKSKDTSEEGDIDLKDLLNLAKSVKGLPSDVSKITDAITQMYQTANLFSLDGKISTSKLVTTYLSALLKIKVAEFNLDLFDKAKEIVKNNDGLHEAAIDEFGRVIVQNVETGDITPMTVGEYTAALKNDDNKYQALTNSNLLNYRAENGAFAFSNNILRVVSNGIGEEKVTEIILKALQNINPTELKREGYTELQADKIAGGIEILKQAHDSGMFDDIKDVLSSEGFHKLGISTSDAKEQLMMALNYLMKAMPANMRTWLMLKSGNLDDPAKGGYDMLNSLIFSRYAPKSEFSVNPISDPNYQKKKDAIDREDKKKEKAKETKEEYDKQDKTSPYILMQKQQGGTYGLFELNSGTSNSLKVAGTVYGALLDSDWKPIGSTSVADLLTRGLSGIVENMNGISFGDKVLTPADLNNIMYDGGGGMMVNLPCKVVNGAKTVDLGIVDQYNSAFEEFRNTPKTQENAEEIFGEILHKYHLDELLDDNGLPNKNRFGLFLVINGYGVDKEKKFYQNTEGQDNNYIENIDPDSSLIDLIETKLSTKNEDDPEKRNYKIDSENWFESSSPDSFWFTFDHVYKGSLYIPISNNEVQGLSASKFELPYAVSHAREYEYQLEQKRRTALTASTDLLNL